MRIGRCGEAEQSLQQAVDMRRRQQIRAARHQCDTLQCVVEGDTEMITAGRFLAREHDIAEARGFGANLAQFFIFERKLARERSRLLDIETQGEGCTGRHARGGQLPV